MAPRLELTILGGAVERAYRKQRPDVERLPWGTLDLAGASPALLRAARAHWSEVTRAEYRTGVACAEVVRLLLASQAPLDLVAMAATFSHDEVVHVELCARMLAELGGGAPTCAPADKLIAPLSRDCQPHLAAAEWIVRCFCVGESTSVPLLRATARALRHPLLRGIVRLIARDEAKHGSFGWIYLDWFEPHLDDAARAHLAGVARSALLPLARSFAAIDGGRGPTREETLAFGWLHPHDYVPLARAALLDHVVKPLRERGIDPGADADFLA